MKLKSKVILSLSSLLAVSFPIATVISCGNLTREGWNDIGANATDKSMIFISKRELVFSGNDGSGSVKYKPDNGKIGMFSQAQAQVTMKLARYKQSTINNDAWEKLFSVDFADSKMQNLDEQGKIKFINRKLARVTNLSAQDKLKIEIVSPIQGYKDKVMKMQPFEIANETLHYNPLKPSGTLIPSIINAKDDKQLDINLDSFQNNSLSEIALSIAEGMGMLISPNLNDTFKNFNPNLIYESIINTHNKGINKISFTYKDKNNKKHNKIFDFSQNKKLKKKLDETTKSFNEIFITPGDPVAKKIKKEKNKKNINQVVKVAFGESKLHKRYEKLFKAVEPDIWSLISNINKDGKAEAIKNLSELILEYSNIFNDLKKWDFLKTWIDEIRFRNLNKLDSIILSTIWRKDKEDNII